ncbi:uncharacterized protein LOC143464718 [Clavelina lepadiformis]|uniref:uncharacterized protein LOC143464718 n=1 Tax=Clavelina lepadiformis TaxID=159417 RepID=UPI004042EF82
METYLLVICTLSLFFGGASAYDYCGGGEYCPYDNTYCCGNSHCCTYVWSLWYFWVGIVAGVILLISCISACVCHVKKKNQRQVQTETVQIVPVPYQTEQQVSQYIFGYSFCLTS